MSSAWTGLANNRDVTQLPHYAINPNSPTDVFFTDRDVAKYCLQVFKRVAHMHKIDLAKYYFIEPSAGEGCFYSLLPKTRRIGLDVEPRDSAIQQCDFLTWYPPTDNDNTNRKKYAVIGNPPFGVRGAYALAFINRALLFADIIGFILPMSFYSNGKGSNMKRVVDAALLHSEKLKSDSFYCPGSGKRFSVNTVFQVWQKGADKLVIPDYDVSEYVDIFTVCSAPSRRCGMKKIGQYDCYISSTYYGNKIKTVKTFDEVNYGSGYGIIINKGYKRRVLSILNNADWNQYASDSTNHCKHLRMYSIRRCLGENGLGRLMGNGESTQHTLL